jgi:hypothetical protein
MATRLPRKRLRSGWPKLGTLAALFVGAYAVHGVGKGPDGIATATLQGTLNQAAKVNGCHSGDAITLSMGRVRR